MEAKEQRDIAEGKGFKMQRVDESSVTIGVAGRGYSKVRSTEPLPYRGGLYRLLTPVEAAKARTIPLDMINGIPATTAREVMGQSLTYEAFYCLSEYLFRHMKQALFSVETLAA